MAWHRSGVSNVRIMFSVAPDCNLISMKLPAKTEDFTRGISVLRFKLYTNITIYFLFQYNELNGTHQSPFFFQKHLLVEIPFLGGGNVTPCSLVLYVCLPCCLYQVMHPHNSGSRFFRNVVVISTTTHDMWVS